MYSAGEGEDYACGVLTTRVWGANTELGGGTPVRSGDNISTVEAMQYGGGLTSVQWRDNITLVGG